MTLPPDVANAADTANADTDNRPMSAAPPPLNAPSASEPQRFIDRLRHSLADDSFVRLVLGRPQGAEPSLHKLLARRIVLRGAEQLSLVWRHQTKDITKNLPIDEALILIGSLLPAGFGHAHLVTRGHDIQLALGKKGRWNLASASWPWSAATRSRGLLALTPMPTANRWRRRWPTTAHGNTRWHWTRPF